jgi:hypothetical protein
MACPSWCVHVGQFHNECLWLVGHRNCGTLTIKPAHRVRRQYNLCLQGSGKSVWVVGGPEHAVRS